MQVFILSAGRPQSGVSPSVLKEMPSGQTVLDWQIQRFKRIVDEDSICVLTGYRSEDIIAKFPKLNYSILSNWENYTPVQSLLHAPIKQNESFISTYGDTVFHADDIDNLIKIDADLVVGVDSFWERRFSGRTDADRDAAEIIHFNSSKFEFTGLVKFNSKAAAYLSTLSVKNYNNNFLGLIKELESSGLKVHYFDLKGRWAELNEPADLVHFLLGTKAETLHNLRRLVSKSIIGDQIVCDWANWSENKGAIIQKIKHKFSNNSLVVRSSSHEEDAWNTANAGVFLSLLNIDGSSENEIATAIEDVYQSYGEVNDRSQVLIQQQVKDVTISGVVFTCGLDSGSPYYFVNFDDTTGSTESITSGLDGNHRFFVISHFNIKYLKKKYANLYALIGAIQEIEEITRFRKLDIEFAIDKKGVVHIFQVRPIVVNHSEFETDLNEVNKYLNSGVEALRNWQTPAPHIFGDKTLFSNMTDWNPAEILGVRPNPLALSLYQYLITDDIWAQQRSQFGYRDVSPSPLVYEICGQGYIDVRASLNSFLPADLPEETAKRFANAYLNYLSDHPYYHDKIEFKVALTVWTPDFNEQIQRFTNYGLTQEDFLLLENSLKNLTKTSLTRLDNDIAPIYELEQRFNQLKNSNINCLDKLCLYVDDCKKYGTLSFSHAARAGFVAMSFLKSFVDIGLISEQRKVEFLNSFSTVAGEFSKDLARDLSNKDLLDKYGHLRPGTYDVTKSAYWENPELYFAVSDRNETNHNLVLTEPKFSLEIHETQKIKDILTELGSEISVETFFTYLENAIKAREKVKFIFTKNLSAALDMCWELGQLNHISREDIGYLRFEELKQLKLSVADISHLRQRIEERKRTSKIFNLIQLPSIITREDDFYVFEKPNALPNYVTQKSIIGQIVSLESKERANLKGKIVLIPNADPGFDWLFNQDIAGLVTQYGGANSHMAIRAAELALPAAIGVGDKMYQQLKTMTSIMLDCSSKQIHKV